MKETINFCFSIATNRQPSEQELYQLTIDMPRNIVSLGAQFGWNNTQVEDQLYLWIKGNEYAARTA